MYTANAPSTETDFELPSGVGILAPYQVPHASILTARALAFIANLHRSLNPRRRELLALRAQRQEARDAGKPLHFLPDTQSIREGDWQCAPLPADLLDRRVEITGPPDRKMVINALNSGAKVYMSDFEDSMSPTWANAIEGQINLRDAVNRTISFHDERKNKSYQLGENPAVLMVRPRGWHLDEVHLTVDGEPVSASLFDFGLYLFHNAAALLARGTGPYFYLPKLESHLEARLWNDAFILAQSWLDLPLGTIKATVLVETLPAAFELNEILYELRDHMAGLNCGRWDYIFSYIKTYRNHADHVLPNRAQVGMTVRNMKSYSELVIQTCHKRGVAALGGMAAQIPVRDNPEENEAALAKVRADKLREAKAGHDGTWVAHPGLVGLATEIFDEYMPGPNQIHRLRTDLCVTEEDLLATPEGTITEAGVRTNVDVGIRYLAAWLAGNGCVPIYNLMEDAATAEISRTQLWQWLKHGAKLASGKTFDTETYRQLFDQTVGQLKAELGENTWESSTYPRAVEMFDEMIRAEVCPDFLTLNAYNELTAA